MQGDNVNKFEINVHDGGQAIIAGDSATVLAVQNNNDRRNDSSGEGDLKFQNNKKQHYIEIWNSRLFLHRNRNEKPITLADAFVMPDYDDHNNKFLIYQKQSLEQRIDNFVNDLKGTSTMLITGVPGIGKSSITSWIANRYEECDCVIILRFRDWDREDLEKGLLKAICNTLECKKSDLNFKILILDGFDELKSLEIREKILAAFFNEILDIKNLRCIITSRPAYVNADNFQHVLELKVFDEKRVQDFYKKIKDIDIERGYINLENLAVLGVPVILYMAIMSNIDITGNATKPELFNRIFAERGGIFDRFYYEGIAYDEGAHPFRDSENIKKYLEFLQEVAFKMYEKNDLLLSVEECRIPELEYQGKAIKIFEFPIKHLFENIEFNIEFIHKSIYEYFVAEYLITRIYKCIRKENVGDLAGVLSKELKNNVLSKEIAEYLSYKILWKNVFMMNFKDVLKLSPAPKSIGLLVNAFSMMLKNGMIYFSEERCKNIIECELNVFSSMLSLFESCLNSENKLSLKYKEEFVSYLSHLQLKSGKINLKYFDLNDTKYENILLNSSSFEEVNFKRAKFNFTNMTDVKFTNADLCETEFIGVNLENAVFTNVNLEGAIFRDSKLKNVKFINSNLKTRLINVDLEGAEFRVSQIHFLDLSYSNLKYIKLIRNVILCRFTTVFDNAIIDIKTMLMVEKVFGNKVHNCRIDMCDNLLSYEEYMVFREQKLAELQYEILEVIETGKNYTEYKSSRNKLV